MKIQSGYGINKLQKSYGKNVQKSGKALDIQSDKLEISSLARDISIARRAFEQLPEVREHKVEEIRNLMNSGKFKPSSADILDRIMGK